jgi:uncharacterized protein (DUF1697 family)
MKYVALLRGIGPGNPNMKNDRLVEVFEGLGFTNVKSVISSGNIIFESEETNVRKLEDRIEKTLPLQLDFSSSTIIRSEADLQKIIDTSPFGSTMDIPKSRLNVTFLKNPMKPSSLLPHFSTYKSYQVFKIDHQTLGSIVDTTTTKTPNLMTWMEKNFSKEITTRTNKTVQRILAKF